MWANVAWPTYQKIVPDVGEILVKSFLYSVQRDVIDGVLFPVC